eukprot:scaffold5428_cov150-Skeletonema_menzelii.AAC.7
MHDFPLYAVSTLHTLWLGSIHLATHNIQVAKYEANSTLKLTLIRPYEAVSSWLQHVQFALAEYYGGLNPRAFRN